MIQIKLAYLIDTIESDTAGTQKQLLTTIRRFDQERVQPILVCLYRSKWMESHTLPCETVTLGYRGFLKRDFPVVVRALASLIEQRGIQILQTFFEDSIFVGFLAASMSRPRPVLLSSRRDIGLGNDRPWYHAVFQAVLPWVNRGFDGIVCNSERVREFVISNERMTARRVHVLPNGVALPEGLEPEPEVFRGSPGDLWIGIVANLTPVKRIDIFLRAFAILRRSSVAAGRARAVILGDGPERPALLALRRALGLDSCVEFMGKVKNVTAFLQRLDVGVLCSDREGLSNAVLEYMTCGLPVVVTSVGGNPELVDESNGYCVPAGDPYALAAALERLIGDSELRAAKGLRSLEKVKELYSWESSMRRLEEFYGQLVDGRTF